MPAVGDYFEGDYVRNGGNPAIAHASASSAINPTLKRMIDVARVLSADGIGGRMATTAKGTRSLGINTIGTR